MKSIETKICAKCKISQPITNFRKDKKSNAGYRYQCKSCSYAYHQAYYLANKERIIKQTVEYMRLNRDKKKAINKRYNTTHADYYKQYDAAHAAERKAIKQRSYAKHRERYKASAKARYAANRDALRKKALEWQKNNPTKVAEREQRRRARKLGAHINSFTAEEWKTMKALTDHRCVYCGKHCQQLTQDHHSPLSGLFPDHSWANIVPACRSCNSKKGRGTPLPMAIPDPRPAFLFLLSWPAARDTLIPPPLPASRP